MEDLSLFPPVMPEAYIAEDAPPGGTGWRHHLEAFIDWCEKHHSGIKTIAIPVRTTTCRQILKLKKKEPLIYRGIALVPIGSTRWRRSNPGVEP